MQEKILQLRSEGKTYNQIVEIVGCSKSLVSYYCGQNQKEKLRSRQRKRRSTCHPYQNKIDRFVYDKQKCSDRITGKSVFKKLIKDKLESFADKHSHPSKRGYKKPMFNLQDVIDKFGESPTCYLTGKSIDIYKPRTYQFDHIIPRSRGGDNSLDNLGICTRQANLAKNDMTPDEFIMFCKQVLTHNGYEVSQ